MEFKFNDFKKWMADCIDAIDAIPTVPFKIAMLCTLFDHVCETNNLDKKQELQTMYAMIMACQNEIGSMYKEDN